MSATILGWALASKGTTWHAVKRGKDGALRLACSASAPHPSCLVTFGAIPKDGHLCDRIGCYNAALREARLV